MANSDNPKKGSDFEMAALRFFESQGISLRRGFVVPIGVSDSTKDHKFDLGSSKPAMLVECKSHTWTGGGNSPSAKLSVWNEAMFYFLAAPTSFRKVLFVLESLRLGEALADHYVRRFRHLIPTGVEIWQYSEQSRTGMRVFPK